MREQEPPLLPSRPDPLILTAQDEDVLQHLLSMEELARLKQAERGELPCLVCEQPVVAMVMIAEEYEGLTLVCLECGYCAY